MIIYKTTNLINGKFYIGKDERNKPNYFGSGKLLLRAIKKYGKENFIKEIIDIAESSEELCLKEVFWIKESNAIKEGYNLTEGGTGGNTMKHSNLIELAEWKQKISNKSRGHTLSKEARAKISKARQGIKLSKETIEKIKIARKNQIITEDHKKKISDSNKGRKVSKVTRDKISKATMGKNKGKEPANKGIPMTQEQKDKLSATLKGTRKGAKNPAYGKRWLNDGKLNIYVKKRDVGKYLKLGYALGMIKLKKM